VKRVYDQSGVVGEHQLPGNMKAVIFGLNTRVRFECVAVFDGRLDLPVLRELIELDTMNPRGAEEVANLARIRGCHQDTEHLLNLLHATGQGNVASGFGSA
jgi:hypothetical protein